ncbi:MAG: ABC transporter substrate-binding protein [Proteobacteria bacterium]|nr:ABC transporter substrate-binding protein [Pseudomonadota bacterium]
MKKLLTIFTVVLCIGMLGTTGAKAAEIPLGLLLPYTGVWAWVGAGADPGADLAVAEINKMPPLGMKIKLHKEDTETKSKPAIEGARKLYDVHKVVGIVGPTSATVRSCIPITKEARAAEISPTAGTTKLDVIGGGIDGEHIYRTVSSDVVMTAGMVWWAMNKMPSKPKVVATFTADTEGSRSIHGGTVDALKAIGMPPVTEIEFALNQASYRAELKNLFAKKPDVIFWEANPETDAVIYKQWYEMGLGGQWIGSDFANRTSAKASLPASEGAIGVNPGLLVNPESDAWIKRLEKVSKKPGYQPFSANTYDATVIFALAIERAGTIAKEWGTTTADHRKAIINSVRKVAQPPGVKVNTYADGIKALRAGKEINYEGMAGTQDWNKFGDPVTYLKAEVMTTKDPTGMKRIGSVTPDMIKDIVDKVLKIRAERAK